MTAIICGFIYLLGVVVMAGFIIGTDSPTNRAALLQIILSLMFWPFVLGVAFGMVCKNFKILLR